MNISIIKEEGLLRQVQLEITEEDYKPNVEKELKKIQKTAYVPGFRQGKVPFAHISKLYGDTVKMQEVDKLATNKLIEYLHNNNIHTIIYPIISDDSPELEPSMNVFTFIFDYVLLPDFKFNYKEYKFKHYIFKPSESEIEKELQSIINYYSEFEQVDEISNEQCYFNGKVSKIQEDESEQSHYFVFSLYKAPEEIKDLFIGKKLKDKVEVSTESLLNKENGITHYLNEEEIKALKEQPTYEVEIFSINQLKKPELNQDFFNKLYPDGSVTTEEELREKIAESLKSQFNHYFDNYSVNKVLDDFEKEVSIEIPEPFARKYFYIAESLKEKPVKNEKKLEKEFQEFYSSMKASVVFDSILTYNNLDVSMAETTQEVKDGIRSYLKSGSEDEELNVDEKKVDNIYKNLIKRNKNIIRDKNYQKKYLNLLNFLKDNCITEEIFLSFEELAEMIQKEKETIKTE